MILTPDQRLRVFVSSTLGELADERQAVRTAVESLRLTPVMFELAARPHAPASLYRAYLGQSHVFVGVYWQQYGWIAPTMPWRSSSPTASSFVSLETADEPSSVPATVSRAPLLGLVQKLVAPRDRVAECLVAFGQVEPSPAEEVEAVFERAWSDGAALALDEALADARALAS